MHSSGAAQSTAAIYGFIFDPHTRSRQQFRIVKFRTTCCCCDYCRRHSQPSQSRRWMLAIIFIEFKIRNSAIHFLFDNWNFALKLFIMMATPVTRTICRSILSLSLHLSPPLQSSPKCRSGDADFKSSRRSSKSARISNYCFELWLLRIGTFFTSPNRSHDQMPVSS